MKAFPGKNGMQMLRPCFIFGSGSAKTACFLTRLGKQTELELEKWECLLKPHRQSCQVMMLFPFYFCGSFNKARTRETQKRGSWCGLAKLLLKILTQQLTRKKMYMNVWMDFQKLSESTHPFLGRFGLWCFCSRFPKSHDFFPCSLKLCSSLTVPTGRSVVDLVRNASLFWS